VREIQSRSGFQPLQSDRDVASTSKNSRKNRVFVSGSKRTLVAMNSTFQIVGLPLANFVSLFPLTESELAERNAKRLTVDAKPGFPCRVSLADAELGERVILLPFTHQSTHSPYQSSGPIFVRETAKETVLAPGEIPEVVRSRLMSVRAYDDKGMMLDAAVTAGSELKPHIEKVFANPRVSYLHLHNAGAGCYSCRVNRMRLSSNV
jgi:hypothetical protein